MAGSDTSATALSHLWFYLLKHPEYYARLRKEVDEAFPRGEDPIDFTRQADMPFLNACMYVSVCVVQCLSLNESQQRSIATIPTCPRRFATARGYRYRRHGHSKPVRLPCSDYACASLTNHSR